MKTISFLLIIIHLGCTSSNAYQFTDYDKYNAPEGYDSFTEETRTKLKNNNIELSKLQFYIDRDIVLERIIDSNSEEINSGKIVSKNDRFIHRIVIPFLTPGICVEQSSDRLGISFEEGEVIYFQKVKRFEGYIPYRIVGYFDSAKDQIFYNNNYYDIYTQDKDFSVYNTSLFYRNKDISKLREKSRTVKGLKIKD